MYSQFPGIRTDGDLGGFSSQFRLCYDIFTHLGIQSQKWYIHALSLSLSPRPTTPPIPITSPHAPNQNEEKNICMVGHWT